MAKLNSQRLIFGLFLLVVIVIGELIMHHFHLPTWPPFMVMIFFFETHMDIKKAPNILVGGLLGILCYVLIRIFVGALAPSIGILTAQLIFICVVVYAIVAFGEILPILFNNYAFMYFLISAVAGRIPEPAPNPWLWMAVHAIGGAIFIACIVGIGKLMAALFTPAEGEGQQAEH